MKKLLATSLLVLAGTTTQAEPTYQAGVMTDLLFRGISKTDNGPAIHAKAENTIGNAYGGVAVNNIDTPDGSEGLPIEMDVYFGYNNQFDGFNIDVEVITYNYLVDTAGDETEFKVGTTPVKGLDLALYRGIKNKTWYPEVTYEKFLPHRLYLDVSAGYWLPDDGDNALTARAELARDFPEFHGIDIYGAVDFISDETPFIDDNNDDSEITLVFGVRKNF